MTSLRLTSAYVVGAVLTLVVGVVPLATTAVGTDAGSGRSVPAQPVTSPASGDPRIDPKLLAAMSGAGGAPVDAVVSLTTQADLSGIASARRGERTRIVERRLRHHARQSQQSLLAYLDRQHAAGKVTSVQPLWINNAVAVSATADVIRQLSRRSDVLAVEADTTVRVPNPSMAAGAGATTVEPNISLTHAPDMWNQGFRGQHLVVATMDTGVDVTHPDLAASWRGGSNSWYDPNGQHPNTPTDVNGHGTQTTGVLVGGSAGGSSIGMAPDAQWIAVKIFNDRGVATSVGIHQGFQWLLDPDKNPSTADAPSIVNSSWSASSTGGCDATFQPDLQALRAAGILPVFAAGNSGPQAGSIFSPANLPEAVAVAGVDNTLKLDPYSSRGPSACPTTQSPALAAPDTAIRTADLYGGYINDTGTSVAAPHVAGAAALLLSALPGLSVERQQSALQAGALDLGASGPDVDTGYGFLDITAAYQWLLSAPDIALSMAPSSVSVDPGGHAGFDLTVDGLHGFADDVTLSLSGLTSTQASWTFSPATVTGGTGTSHLDITVSGALASGTYPLVVRASGGGLERATSASLIVTAPPPDFSVSASPTTRTVQRGSATTYGIGVSGLNGFVAAVSITASGLPSTVGTTTVNPGSVTPPGSSTVTATIRADAPPGSYPIVVTGTSGTVQHATSVTLVVAPDFTVTARPTRQTVSRNQTAQFTIDVGAVGAFTGGVQVSDSGAPPRSLTSWSATSVPAVPGSVTYSVRITSATQRGSYLITIVGAQGGLTHQTQVWVTVR